MTFIFITIFKSTFLVKNLQDIKALYLPLRNFKFQLNLRLWKNDLVKVKIRILFQLAEINY
jgi:hypothetical protein